MTREPDREVATLGGGCFWCLEAVYKDLKGVERVVSGYAGGHADNPTYEQVCGGRTGHAEVVQITFDPAVVTFGDLLDVFFTIHDPTTKDRQGADVGPQYRSIILHHGPEQKAAAERAIADLSEKKIWRAPIVTDFSLNTMGSRLFGENGNWLYEFEGGYQFGRQSGLQQNQDAGFGTAGVGHKYPDRLWKPTVWFYYDYASGNFPGGDFNRFNQLFPLGHKYFGFIDAVQRSNIESP